MQSIKENKMILLLTPILFLLFYFAFVTFNIFPNKYSLVDRSIDQLVLETGVFNKQTVLVSAGDHFELISSIINHSLESINYLLIAIAILLAPIVVVGIDIIRKGIEKKPYLISIGILAGMLLVFLYLYYLEVSKIETFL